MATSTITNYTSIPSPPTATLFATMRYGTNGSTGGLPELMIGNSASDASNGRMTWDQNSGAFDTGLVPFEVAVPPNGGSANPDLLSVSDAVTNPVSYSLMNYGSIATVQVMVGVQINASSAITDLIMQFYNAGTLIETFNLASGPSVDTTSASSPVAAQMLTVTPASGANDQVMISGTLQMQAPNGTFPDVNDIFAQCFIQTLTASVSGGGPGPGTPVSGDPTSGGGLDG